VDCLTTTPSLIDDTHLLPVDGPPPRGAEPGLARDLRTASSARDRHQTVTAALEAFGARWLGYAQVGLIHGRPRLRRWFTPHGHGAWMRSSVTDRHHEVDPRFADAVALRAPFAWDIGTLERRVEAAPRAAQGRGLVADLRARGIRSGLWLGVPGDTPDDYTVIGIDGTSETSCWLTDGVIGQALVAALSVHAFLLPRLPKAGEPGPPEGLSATQRGVLDGLLAGHSDKVIADRLQLSSHTVDYHMRELRRRFSARNRVQLVHAVVARETTHIW
jgi:DNA-binding CsgD family transcriptional regulator